MPFHDAVGWKPCTATAVLCAAAAGAVAETPPPGSEDWLYEVQRGDHLVGIAQKMLGDARDWRRLQRLNRITAPRRLQPGRQLRIPQAWLRADAVAAELRLVTGQVSVRSPDGRVTPAREGGTLRGRETLETGTESSVQLRFVDGSQVRVSPVSRLTLEQAQVLRGSGQGVQVLRLQQGEVESQVRRDPPRPRFEIRSPVLRLGARGTDFRAAFDPATQTARGAVDRGRVEARAESPAALVTAALLGDGIGIVASPQGVSRPVELLPPVPLPAVPLRVERLPVRVRWSALAATWPAASAWQAQVLSSEQALVAERRGDGPEADFGALADGSYRLRLRAVDAQGLAGRESGVELSVAARPEPPFLSAPATGAVVVGARAALAWVRSSAAARYRLQVATAADFDNPAHDLRDVEGTAATVELAPGSWYWRLASIRADGHQGPWSDVQAFEQRPEPPPAAPAAPTTDPAADGALRFRFSAGRPGDLYEFQLTRIERGQAPDFARPLLERQSDTPELLLEGLDAGGYALRARVVDARGQAGPWGPDGSFEVTRSSSSWWWVPAALILLLLW